MICKFTCPRCGLGATPFEVRDIDPGESLAWFVRAVVLPAAALAHRRFGPHCDATRLDLLVPNHRPTPANVGVEPQESP